ncbi:MAG TPA: hypothetical protein VE445_01855 [Nitrososphaeraceae archaeon]|jgi:hypothetical protein|nr:hypothetical protein [Nitrososphaeraceae archaeon]
MMSKMHVVIMSMLLNLRRTVKLQFLVEYIRLLKDQKILIHGGPGAPEPARAL